MISMLSPSKVMLGALDPLGMPLGPLAVAGDGADDELYVPAIDFGITNW